MRIFRATDGMKESYVSAIALSPRGNVCIKHGDVDEFTVFDGYSFRTVPSPNRDNNRIYQGRSGQFWSVYSEGLLVYDGSQWVRHPIPEIHNEVQLDALRQSGIRPIPFVPIEQDRALFLLSDRLMEYDARHRVTTVIKTARDTGLEKFTEMSEARDRGLWVSGATGIARIFDTIKDLTPQTPWTEQIIRDQSQVENLQRPFETKGGGIVTTASDLLVNNRRLVLRFDGTTWSRRTVEGENVRQAWAGLDQTLWGYTYGSLLRFDGVPQPAVAKERIGVGQFKDVAVETNGAFWLATSEGLVRYAPYSWRTPAEIESVDNLIHGVCEAPDGRIWFAGSEGLILFQNNQWKTYKWPTGLDADFQITDNLCFLTNGEVIIGADNKLLAFDPATEGFGYVEHPSLLKTRLVGQSANGKVLVQTSPAFPFVSGAYQIEEFDGTNFTAIIRSGSDWGLDGPLYVAKPGQNGDWWLGGAGGLGLYHDGHFQKFGPLQGFAAERAFCLLEKSDSEIWCGTETGIFAFNGRTWSTIRMGPERINQMVKGKDRKIWIATSYGLYSYLDGVWLTNGPEDGLPSASISKMLQDKKDLLWAATSRGISLYHPDADASPPKTLKPFIQNSGKLMADEPVTILFNGVDKWFNTPSDHLLFSYRLDEGSWFPYTNIVGKSFENIGAGDHRLEVRAMDRNWNADPSRAYVEFSLVIPWYKEARILAIVGCGGILILFFAGLAVNRHLQLIHSYAEVEKIVAIRTQELERANQELLHSQKMKALGTLAAGIAHDFNNILSIIKGSAQIIENNVDDEGKIRTRVSRIKTVVDQGAGIVKSMLGLSRVSEKDLLQCDVNAIIEDTLRLLLDRFPQELALHFEAAPSLPQVLGIKDLIQQMLLNLIFNSADAMSYEGRILIKTGETHHLPPNLVLGPRASDRYIYIAIQDSGCGISPEILPRIFEPFFTTKAFSSRRGTGLGLSMVYELAKEMGFGLKVKSEVNSGSTFTIFMPVTSAA